MIFDPMKETSLITVEDVELLTETAVPIADGMMSIVSVASGRVASGRVALWRVVSGRVVKHAPLAAESVFVSQESR